MGDFSECIVDIHQTEWINGKSFAEAWATCQRGDWMLEWAKKMDLCDDRTFTLIKARCAELVSELIGNHVYKEALGACVRFANGEITSTELEAFAEKANKAEYSFGNGSAAAEQAAYAAAHNNDYYMYAGDVVRFAASTNPYHATHVIRACADICREVLPVA